MCARWWFFKEIKQASCYQYSEGGWQNLFFLCLCRRLLWFLWQKKTAFDLQTSKYFPNIHKARSPCRTGTCGWDVWTWKKLQHKWRHRLGFSIHHLTRNRSQVRMISQPKGTQLRMGFCSVFPHFLKGDSHGTTTDPLLRHLCRMWQNQFFWCCFWPDQTWDVLGTGRGRGSQRHTWQKFSSFPIVVQPQPSVLHTV